MASTYSLTHSARRDLRDIREADEDVAIRVIGSLIDTILTMSLHPHAGVAEDWIETGVRKFPVGKFMVYYRPDEA